MAVKKTSGEEGQAIMEYIVVVSAIVGIYLIAAEALIRFGLAKKLVAPLTTTFAAAYRYGNVQAKGYEDGGPSYHPRADTDGSNNNFRLFFNPDFQ